MLRLLRAAAALALLLVTPALAQYGIVHLGPINISAPFSRATLPNAPVGGGYLTIENTGTEADRLVSATGNGFVGAQARRRPATACLLPGAPS